MDKVNVAQRSVRSFGYSVGWVCRRVVLLGVLPLRNRVEEWAMEELGNRAGILIQVLFHLRDIDLTLNVIK